MPAALPKGSRGLGVPGAVRKAPGLPPAYPATREPVSQLLATPAPPMRLLCGALHFLRAMDGELWQFGAEPGIPDREALFAAPSVRNFRQERIVWKIRQRLKLGISLRSHIFQRIRSDTASGKPDAPLAPGSGGGFPDPLFHVVLLFFYMWHEDCLGESVENGLSLFGRTTTFKET